MLPLTSQGHARIHPREGSPQRVEAPQGFFLVYLFFLPNSIANPQ